MFLIALQRAAGLLWCNVSEPTESAPQPWVCGQLICHREMRKFLFTSSGMTRKTNLVYAKELSLLSSNEVELSGREEFVVLRLQYRSDYKMEILFVVHDRVQRKQTEKRPSPECENRRLTENMRRLKQDSRPVTNLMRNLSALSSWYSVYMTAIVFTVYMYAAWHGWTIPIFLSWRIQWSIIPQVSESLEPPKENLNVSEKFQLVLNVGHKAQNLFGDMADILEKTKNLFMWVRPELTQKFYMGCVAPSYSSTLMPPTPSGPTYPLTSVFFAALLGASREEGRYYNTKRGAFHELFSLPESERPLPVCENSWLCCLINRDRKIPTHYCTSVPESYILRRTTCVLRANPLGKVIEVNPQCECVFHHHYVFFFLSCVYTEYFHIVNSCTLHFKLFQDVTEKQCDLC
uniref:Uncharacterized protein n=1 Tax=Xiphophorus maculatus TaxID=8083 RepID=A0A3B5Q4W4_XIPMA